MRKYWHREEIKAAVRMRGETLRSLAHQNGLSSSVMSRSLRTRLPTYNEVIARFLGISTGELWPRWYGPDGTPHGRARPDARTRRVRRAAAE